MNKNRITIRVWGDFACYSRPEMKVERVSYEVPTPSAARGILEAIYWEPQMYYLIDTIYIIKPGTWFSLRRNEVDRVISSDNALQWMRGSEPVSPILAGGGSADCSQRNMLARQNVEYLITAEVRLSQLASPPRDNLGKYLDKVRSRAAAGKCFHRPGLGMREFAADFDLVEGDPQAEAEQRTVGTPMNSSLGLMLYDVFDHRLRGRGFRWLSADDLAAAKADFATSLQGLGIREAGKLRKARKPATHAGSILAPAPAFFQAEVKAGAMDCHPDRVRIIYPANS